MDPGWLTAFTALTVATVGFLAWLTRKTWRLVRRIVHFLDDYGGEPERDGMAARPGLMARLASVEKSLAHVVAETSPNHGRSLRDIILRTHEDVSDIKAEQAALRGRVELFEQRRNGL